LGGVGAVLMGAMLLLTVKVGPASSQPVPSSSAKNDPLAAVAAVPEAPPRRTPAAAPHAGPAQAAAMQRTILVVMPADHDVDVDEDQADEGAARPIEIPQALDCSFKLDLPVNISAF